MEWICWEERGNGRALRPWNSWRRGLGNVSVAGAFLRLEPGQRTPLLVCTRIRFSDGYCRTKWGIDESTPSVECG